MRVCFLLAFLCVLLPPENREAAQVAPQLILGTYLGGRDKDFASAIAVDDLRAAYVAGRTSSPDFPVTQGALIVTSRLNNDDWIGLVAKISEKGDRHLSAQNDSILARFRSFNGQLQFATFLGGTRVKTADRHNDAATSVVADASGNVYVSGYRIYDRLPVTQSAPQARRKGNTEPFALRMNFAVSR